MERLSDSAIDIINDLHTERMDYYSEYLPLIDAALRLAAYEDTGLSPEDFKKVFDMAAVLKMAAQSLGTTPDHLRELVQAEQAGRLVVLPCNVGDTVWTLDGNDGVCCHQIRRFGRNKYGDFACSALIFPLDDFGKTVFLTRSEAEAALEAQERDK